MYKTRISRGKAKAQCENLFADFFHLGMILLTIAKTRYEIHIQMRKKASELRHNFMILFWQSPAFHLVMSVGQKDLNFDVIMCVIIISYQASSIRYGFSSSLVCPGSDVLSVLLLLSSFLT